MNKEWSSDELKLLKNLSEAFQGKRWKKISRQFEAHGFHRSEYECRNKWVNYLNPEIDHREWTHEELQVLYDEYQKHKSQWALIQKSLPARTQIKIRNQFYGAIRNLVRFLIKYFKNVGNSWSLISNKIRPEVLQNLYNGEKEFAFVGGIVKDAIFEMEFRFDRIKFMEIIELNEEVFKKANDLILESLQNLNELMEGSQELEAHRNNDGTPAFVHPIAQVNKNTTNLLPIPHDPEERSLSSQIKNRTFSLPLPEQNYSLPFCYPQFPYMMQMPQFSSMYYPFGPWAPSGPIHPQL